MAQEYWSGTLRIKLKVRMRNEKSPLSLADFFSRKLSGEDYPFAAAFAAARAAIFAALFAALAVAFAAVLAAAFAAAFSVAFANFLAATFSLCLADTPSRAWTDTLVFVATLAACAEVDVATSASVIIDAVSNFFIFNTFQKALGSVCSKYRATICGIHLGSL
jgi:hypothetical protein